MDLPLAYRVASFCSPIRPRFACRLPLGHEAIASTWQTVSEAAEELLEDVSDLDLAKARARVSIASRRGCFTSNGKAKYEHRIEPVSYAAWRLQQRERELERWDREDAA